MMEDRNGLHEFKSQFSAREQRPVMQQAVTCNRCNFEWISNAFTTGHQSTSLRRHNYRSMPYCTTFYMEDCFCASESNEIDYCSIVL